MSRHARVRGSTVLALAALLAAGCGGEESGGDSPRAVQMDTTNPEWEDGLSDEQVQAKARAMTPEEAARAGIRDDSTIHVENLGSQDTTPAGVAGPSGVGRPGAPVARTDTTPPRPGTRPGAPVDTARRP